MVHLKKKNISFVLQQPFHQYLKVHFIFIRFSLFSLHYLFTFTLKKKTFLHGRHVQFPSDFFFFPPLSLRTFHSFSSFSFFFLFCLNSKEWRLQIQKYRNVFILYSYGNISKYTCRNMCSKKKTKLLFGALLLFISSTSPLNILPFFF